MSGDELDYQLISSLRYDREALLSARWNTSRNGDRQSPYLLLPYTVDRFTAATEVHSWATPSEFNLHWLERRCDASLKDKDPYQPHKVLGKSIARFLYQTHLSLDSHRPLKTGGIFY